MILEKTYKEEIEPGTRMAAGHPKRRVGHGSGRLNIIMAPSVPESDTMIGHMVLVRLNSARVGVPR
jgi:hypothetical protein